MKLKKIPRSRYPQIAENNAVNTLLSAYKELRERWKGRLSVNTRRDDAFDTDFFDVLYRELEEMILAWAGELRLAGRDALRQMQLLFIMQFRAAYGADPLLNEFWAEVEFERFVEDVLRRCQGSCREATGKMRGAVSKGQKRNRSQEQIEAQIQVLFDVLEARFIFAIRDEMGDFVSKTTERRHKSFGIEEYIWHDRRDKHVRGNPAGLYPHARHSHWHRNDLMFRYDDPPKDGNPGEPDGCRCMATPVFPTHGRRESGWLAWLLAGAAAGAAYELNKEEV